jgi:hypothetical protein
MQALRLDHFGSPDVLQVLDVPQPEARPDEVLLFMPRQSMLLILRLWRSNETRLPPITPSRFRWRRCCTRRCTRL